LSEEAAGAVPLPLVLFGSRQAGYRFFLFGPQCGPNRWDISLTRLWSNLLR
jgi:hypothetical protein